MHTPTVDFDFGGVEEEEEEEVARVSDTVQPQILCGQLAIGLPAGGGGRG